MCSIALDYKSVFDKERACIVGLNPMAVEDYV